jgi:hypothetical protein
MVHVRQTTFQVARELFADTGKHGEALRLIHAYLPAWISGLA